MQPLSICFAYLAMMFLTACVPFGWRTPTEPTQQVHADQSECLAIGEVGSPNLGVIPTIGSSAETANGCINKDWITAVAVSIATHDAKGAKKSVTPTLQEVMQKAGFDWHLKQRHGAELFVKSGSAKQVGEALTVQASEIYPATDLVGCSDGHNVTVRWKICNYNLPKEGSFLYVKSCTLFYRSEPVCGKTYNPPIKQEVNQASPWKKWFSHNSILLLDSPASN